MGQGKLPVDLSIIFADNYVTTPTQVRTGPLTMGVDFFPGTGSPHDWSTLIAFDTPYEYTGGILALEVRNDGPAQSPLFLDGFSGPNPNDGTGHIISYNIGDDNATFANSPFFVGNWVVNLRTEPVPEPATAGLALVGLAGLLALPRTRSRARSLVGWIRSQ
jgi:hypothetical protein